MNDPRLYNRSFLSQKIFQFIEYVIGPTSVKKSSPYLLKDLHEYNKSPNCKKVCPYSLNDPSIYNRPLLSQKNIISWMTLYIIDSLSVKKVTSTYWMTDVNILNPLTVKKIANIYWMTRVYIVSPSSVRKSSHLLNDSWRIIGSSVKIFFLICWLTLYIIGLSWVENISYLLNDPLCMW